MLLVWVVLVKYDILSTNNLSSIKWEQLNPSKPYYFFKSINLNLSKIYNKGFFLSDLFINKNTGVQTKNEL